MNFSTNLNLWFAFVVLCTILNHQCLSLHLPKLINEKELLSTKKQFFSKEINNAQSIRVKRHQYFTINKDNPDELQNIAIQSIECGINGKSRGLAKPFDTSPIHDWPWIAVLLNRNYHDNFCGGVLLNRNYVLTAAHCLERKKSRQILVRLGEYDLTLQNDTRHSEFGVAQIKLHKDYSSSTYQHDIALIRLNRTVKYTNFIRPICLPTAGVELKPNQTAIVAGWGAIFYGGTTSSVLLEVSVPIWDLDTCISKYVPTVFHTNICAAGYGGNKDSCVGDSGGPLVVQQPNGRWTNVGIVSWGMACGDKEHPGIYTKVEAYLDWIKYHTRDAVA